MSDLFEDDDEKELLSEDDFADTESAILTHAHRSESDARRRLENLLEEKKLRDELEDFFDY